MRTIVTIMLVAALAGSANAAAVDPAAALAAAKSSIAAKDFAKAAADLAPAIEAASKISDEAQRKQALTALHFYSAVAYSGMSRDQEALAHLEETLGLMPAMRSVDPTRYDAHFVALFERAKADLASTGRFEELYPGFSSVAPVEIGVAEIDRDPGVEILGSRQEKRQWHDTASSTDRSQFLTSFWATRDHTPGTPENEFRDMFLRRAAFADTAFNSKGERGSLTDRGRVFALLGAPALVRRRALDSRDAARVQALSRGGLDIPVGTVEYWIYRRDQLSVPQAQPTVTFRFVSHQGVGTFVLQKDGLAINTLTAATNAASRE